MCLELTSVRWEHSLRRGSAVKGRGGGLRPGLPLGLRRAGGDDDDGQHEDSEKEPHFVASEGERATRTATDELYRPGTPDLCLNS